MRPASLPTHGDLFADRYRIEGPIGRGAMGDIYRAFDTVLERTIALKLLRPSTVGGMPRLLREARACASFEHPNVVRIYDVGESERTGFIAMELLEGISLRERASAAPVPLALRMEWLLDIARALDAAHRAGVMHRDVKPANVMVCSDGVVRLIDFGIATSFDPDAPPASATQGVGTPRYMAPEQRVGIATPASDQFAWGILAMELLASPAITEAGVPSAEEFRAAVPGIPTEWVDAIVRATSLDFRERFPSLADAVRALALESARSRADTQVRISPSSEPPSATSELRAGHVVDGRYRIERIVGRGGMGVVYAAEQLVLKHKVAVKVLTARATPESIARFAQEARVASQLKSVHAVRMLDVATPEGRAPYLVMELLQGADLDEVLQKRGRISLAQAAQWILQACEALAEAHRHGVVHRDIKPGNLFLARQPDGSEQIKVLDFGLSKIARTTTAVVADEESSLSKTFAFMGSPSYVSPEQLFNTKGVDHRTDIWSLAVVLYELYTGSLPFDADNPGALLLAVSNAAWVSVGRRRADAPRELEVFFARCFTKDPEQRFADVAAFARGLAPFANEGTLAGVNSAPPISIPAPPPPSQRSTTARGRRKHVPFAMFAGAAAIIATAIAGAWLAAHDAHRPKIEPARAMSPVAPMQPSPIEHRETVPSATPVVTTSPSPLEIDLEPAGDAGAGNSSRIRNKKQSGKSNGAFVGVQVRTPTFSPYESFHPVTERFE